MHFLFPEFGRVFGLQGESSFSTLSFDFVFSLFVLLSPVILYYSIKEFQKCDSQDDKAGCRFHKLGPVFIESILVIVLLYKLGVLTSYAYGSASSYTSSLREKLLN
jgi:hypothetical protein